MDNKQIHGLYTRMALNTNDMIDPEFSKSIKFAVDEYIGDDIPKTQYCKSFHEIILLSYKLYLQDKFFSIGVYDNKNNFNGSDALLCWMDEPQKSKFKDIEYSTQMKLERLEKLERFILHYKISDDKINEICNK